MQNSLSKRISFILYYGFSWLFALLPNFILYRIADFVFVIIFYLTNYRKKVVLGNLRNSFPEKSEKELREIARKFYKNLSDILIETLFLPHRSKKYFDKHVHYKNIQILNDLYEQNRNVILVISHYANWEVLPHLASQIKHNGAAIHKTINNSFLDNYMIRVRERFGTKQFAMHETFRELIKLSREDKPFSIGVISDQTPHRGKITYRTKFLNQDTAVFLGIEKFAKKYDAPVVFLKLDRIKRGHYSVDFSLLYNEPNKTELYEITNGHTEFLEEIIRKKPENWLWSHRRWKY